MYWYVPIHTLYVRMYNYSFLQAGFPDMEEPIMLEIAGLYGVQLSDAEEESGFHHQPGPFTLKNYCL